MAGSDPRYRRRPEWPSRDWDDDYEEISSDEVDRVVEALETLMATVDSENIRYYLEEATNSIYLLIYDDDTTSEAA